MLKHTGSARDPFELEKSSTPRTTGLGWVIAGLALICIIVAAAHSGGLFQDNAAHVAATSSSQG